MGLLQGSWQYATASCLVARALEAEFVGGPGGLQGLDVFVDDVVTPLEVNTEGEVFAFHVAGPEAECYTTAGEHVECGNCAGRDEWIAIGEHEDAGLQPDLLGRGGQQGQDDEGVLCIVTTGVEPLAGRAGMIGDVAAVEAGALEHRTNLGYGFGTQKFRRIRDVVKRQCDVDFQVSPP